MGVTTDQIIAFYIVMASVSFSGVIEAFAISKDKGGDWEGKE